MVRLIILDIEGVIALPGGSEHPWPLEAMLRLRNVLAESPAACILCTGRQEPYGEAMIQALALFKPLPDKRRERARALGCPLFGWPSILENGAYLYDPLIKHPLPHPALTLEALATMRQVRGELLALAARTGALVEAGKDFTVSLNPPLTEPGAPERRSTDSFRPEVEAALAGYLDRLEVKHSASAIDVMPREVSKASAVQRVLELTGLAPEEVLGVGDSAADAAWLEGVGWRTAPANGREALPGLDYYSPYPVIEGLLDILERLRATGWKGLG